MESPQISIILPVYNGEKYLASAINSVLTQSHHDWELLVVDDGSADTTPAICDSFAATDSRIKAFHQPNGGVNAARAKGIDKASGTFLTFLDADDALLPHALEYMTGLFHDGIDLVANGKHNKVLSRGDYAKALWRGETGLVLWGKMFRTSMFKQVDYNLDRRLVMGEDLLLNSIYALRIGSAVIFSRAVYNVNRDNETSVTRTFKHNWEYEKFYFDEVNENFLSQCRDWDSYEEIELLVNKCWLNAMKYVMLDGGRIDYSDPAFLSVRNYFNEKKALLGPSEKMILLLKNPYLYRIILKAYMYILSSNKR